MAAEDDRMLVHVNGAAREVKRGATVADLLVGLGVERTRVAVERNRDVVPRRDYDHVVLAPDDQIEVVAFVGGG
jgi:thiamine biosynthesis protein ThiS